MNGRIQLSLLFLAAALLAASAPASSESAETADIVLEKKISPEKGTKSRRVHTVREGESISLILEAAGIPAGRLAEALPLLLEHNPDLTDPDRITVGQKIFLPEFPPSLFGPVRRSPAPPRSGSRPAAALPPLGDLGEGERLLSFLEKSFQMIDENLRTSGTLTLPLTAPGIVSIDNAEYPLLDLSSGRGIILDFGGKMSRERSRQIESRWTDYRVLAVPPEADFLQLLEGIFSVSGFHSVSRRQPLDLGRHGEIRLTPDFLLSKEARSLLDGALFLIDVEPPGSEELPTFIRESVDDHGMRLVEFFPGGGRVRANASPAGIAGKKFIASGVGPLLAELAPSLGLAVKAPYRYRHADEGSPRPTAEIEADLFIEGQETTCLVFFDGPAEDESDLLRKNGVHYIALGREARLPNVLGEFFTHFGYEYSGPVVEFFLPGGRYSFTLDGFYLKGKEGSRFLATDHLEENIASFLSSRGIEVLAAVISP